MFDIKVSTVYWIRLLPKKKNCILKNVWAHTDGSLFTTPWMRFQHLPFNYDLIEDGVHKANEIDFAIIIIHLMTTKLTAKNSKFLWLKWKAWKATARIDLSHSFIGWLVYSHLIHTLNKPNNKIWPYIYQKKKTLERNKKLKVRCKIWLCGTDIRLTTPNIPFLGPMAPDM